MDHGRATAVSFRNAFGIYHVLERLLKGSETPLTSVELFDSPDVKQHCEDVNKVSDYLGHMYRRGLLSRVPSRGIGMAKWAYFWKDQKVGSRVQTPQQRHAQPRLMVRDERLLKDVTKMQKQTLKVIHERPTVRITETGDGIVIDLAQLVITIAAK